MPAAANRGPAKGARRHGLNEELGYGSLSGLGQREHSEMAGRVFDRLTPLFETAAADGALINVETSGVDRAVDSAQSFIDGLKDAEPALGPLIQAPVTNTETLYFHDTDQEYTAYVDGDERLFQKRSSGSVAFIPVPR